MIKFINPWKTAKGFIDLGTFEDSTGYYELYCFDDSLFDHVAIGARYGEDGDYISASLGLDDRMAKPDIHYKREKHLAVTSSCPAIIAAVKRMKEQGIVKGDVYYYCEGYKTI